MNIAVENCSGVSVASLPGENLDASNVVEFKKSIAPILEANSEVVFDIAELRFVDSSGLGALLSCLRQQNMAGGDVVLCNISKPVRALFELVRIHRVFDLRNSRDEAVATFQSRTAPAAVDQPA